MSEEKPGPPGDSEDDLATHRGAPPPPAQASADSGEEKTLRPASDPSAKGETARWGEEQTLVGAGASKPAPGKAQSDSAAHSRQSAGARVDGDLRNAPVTPEQPERYSTTRDQGAGGQGVVSVVRDAVIGREVALKMLRPGRSSSDDTNAGAKARFLREARITGQLEHPSIVPVHELGRRADGSLYYTQKLIRGRTLRAALSECKTLGERLRLLPHFVDICQAVAYAHGRGVVHRDLKPENVMVGEFGETVVLDWGLAKVLGQSEPEHAPTAKIIRAPAADAEDSASARAARANLFFSDVPSVDADSAQTREGEIFGTAQYMSPEQAAGHQGEIDQLSDIWTLGAILYELLCGRAPSVRPGEKLELKRIVLGLFDKVASIEPLAPPELAAVAERALNRDRSLRYQTASALAAEVGAFLLGDRVSVYDYSLWELVKKLARKHPIPTATSAAAVLVLLVATLLIASSHRHAIAALSETLAIHAASAEVEERWDLAAAGYAASRAQEERADARMGEAFAESMAPRPMLRLSLHGPPAFAAIYLSDSRLAGSNADGGLAIWDAQSGAQLAQTEAHRGSIWALAASGNLLASGGADGRVYLWNAALQEQGELPLDLGGVGMHAADRASDEGGEGNATGGIAAVEFSSDGKLLAVSSLEHGVDLFEVASRKRVLHFANLERVFALAFSPDGKLLAAGTADGALRTFDLAGNELFHRAAHTGRVRAVAFSPDGSQLASGGQDTHVLLWKTAALLAGSSEAPRRLDGHQRAITSLRFSPDGNALVSSSRDGLLIFWDAATARPLTRLDADERAGGGVAFSPDGHSLAAAYQDSVVRTWSLPASRSIAGLAGHTDQVRAVAFAPDGATLASISQDGTARIWDRQTGRSLRKLGQGDSSEKLRAVAFSRDGAMLATAGDDALELWDPASGAHLRSLLGNSDGTGAVAFAPGDLLLASGGRDGIVKLWNPKTGALIKQVPSLHPAVESIAFNPQGDLLATAGNDGHLRLWQIPSLRLLQDLHAHGEAGRGVAFSPDGKQLASGGSDRRLVIYETATWTQIRELSGHKGRVQGVAYSPNGLWLASSCSDRAVRIFSAATGELLWSSARHEGAVMDLAWSSDSAVLATASADQTLELLRIGDLARLPPANRALKTVLDAQWLHLVGQRIEPLPPSQRPPH